MADIVNIDVRGYGRIYKRIMRDPSLPLIAKAIYAYFCAYAGSSTKAFPRRDKITSDLQINKDTFTKHLALLVDEGYISKERTAAGNLYTIMQTVPSYDTAYNIPADIQEQSDILIMENVQAHGFGTVPKLVMLDPHLSAQAKAIYAYFASFAGAGTTAFPRRTTIMRELHILYLAEGDNRLVIDVRQQEWLQYLYHLLQKDKSINLRELEDTTFQNSLVTNAQNEQYTAEFVFSFVCADPKAASVHKKKSYLIQNTRHRYELAGDGWVYLKLYGVNSRENEFLTKYLVPALQELCVQNFFFLRHEDTARHLRLRLQFKHEDTAIEQLKVLRRYLALWKENGLLEHVVFDTYEPEFNRYGGQELSREMHNIFHHDSLWVITLLEHFSMDDTQEKEKAYSVGMVSAFLAPTSSEDELFAILDEESLRNAGQTEFKKQRRKYLDWFESLKEGAPERIDRRFAAITQPFFQQQQAYKAFGEKMKCFNEIELTNTKNEIIYFLVHMFCNRTTGVLSYESHCLSLIRHTVYNYLQKQKHVCKQALLSDKQ